MATKPQRKPKGSYHHPDLARALLDAALRTIRERGIEALTLRDIGAQLGVSRTAIYRHFKDKSDLLARVALEGFRIFRNGLLEASERARKEGIDALEEMGAAYIRFACGNPSHYTTMFIASIGPWDAYPELLAEADAAFAVLLNTITEEQTARRIAKSHDPLQLACMAWSTAHGIATLGIGCHLGALGETTEGLEDLSRRNTRIFLAGLRPPGKPPRYSKTT